MCEQDNLIRLMGYNPTETTPIAHRHNQHDKNRCDRNGYFSCDPRRAPSDEQYAHQRQINGHHQIFENSDRQDERCLGVLHPSQFSQNLGNNSRR